MVNTTCRLELMGLPDVSAYQGLCRNLLIKGLHLFSGFNVPNKKPGEPLLEWASVLCEKFPSSNVCVHYSLKHQRGNGDPTAMFERFCEEARAVGVSSILLVSGPNGPRFDSTAMLAKLKRSYAPGGLIRLGVAFNACLPTAEERLAEQARLVKKLQTGLVQEVWLNCGSDPYLLQEGVVFARETASKLGLPDMSIFGSVLLPNDAQLQQMRVRPWNGVHFSDEYLASVDGMDRVTTEVLRTFHALGVEPIVESKVRHVSDLSKLEALLVAAKSQEICTDVAKRKEICTDVGDATESKSENCQWPSKWSNRGPGQNRWRSNPNGYPSAESAAQDLRPTRRWSGRGRG